MGRVTRAIAGLNLLGVWASGALLFVCAGLIGVEVIARKFFGWSFEGVDEIAGYGLAISSAWAFGFTLIHRAHIRIDTLHDRLPRRVQMVLDLAGLVLMLAFFGLLAWFAGQLLVRTIELDAKAMTPLATPLVWPQSFWAAGLAVFVVLGTALLVEAALALRRGDAAGVAALIGSRSSEEEIREELLDAQARRARGGKAEERGELLSLPQ